MQNYSLTFSEHVDQGVCKCFIRVEKPQIDFPSYGYSFHVNLDI